MNKEDKSAFHLNNIEKQNEEIDKRLIRYIFNVDTIMYISYAAGKILQGLTLKDDEEIKSLKTILLKDHTSYAIFSNNKINGISHKIHDCRPYYCTCD